MSTMGKKDGKIGLLGCIGIVVGGMIGSAIFSLSGLTIHKSGNAAVFAWIAAAAVMLVYGICCAKLAMAYPESGGVYVFPAKAFGSAFAGWISTWAFVVTNIVAVAFNAIYAGRYIGYGFGINEKFYVFVALASVLFCVILNLADFSVTGLLNSLLVVFLVLTLCYYIATATLSPQRSAVVLRPDLSAVGSIPTAMLAYGSIVSVTFLVSEVRKPEKNITRAVVIATALVVALYVAVLIATLGFVSKEYLDRNPGFVYMPVFAACEKSGNMLLKKTVSVSAALALLTTILVIISVTIRALQAAASDGVLSGPFRKNSFNALLIALLSGVLVLFPSLTDSLVNLGALLSALTVAVTFAAFFKALGKKNIVLTILAAVSMLVILLCYVTDTFSNVKIWIWTAVIFAVGCLIFKARVLVRR